MLASQSSTIAPQRVKPYVQRGRKNDAADAKGICEAMGRPEMPFVPVKTSAIMRAHSRCSQ